jgi:hypothetical protein
MSGLQTARLIQKEMFMLLRDYLCKNKKLSGWLIFSMQNLLLNNIYEDPPLPVHMAPYLAPPSRQPLPHNGHYQDWIGGRPFLRRTLIVESTKNCKLTS